MTRDILGGVPIAGVTGLNGAGKTLWAVDQAITKMIAGIPVYSTVPILSEWGNSEPILSLRQLTELSDCHVLLDEVAVIFSSRTSSSLPTEAQILLQTARHRKITITWTAPGWMRCDVMLREVTQAVLSVSPLLRKNSKESPWPQPLLTMAGLLDTSSGKTDATPDRVMRRALSIPARMRAWGSYDTFADTPMLGHHFQAGVCLDCGGSRTRPKHDKARHDLLGIPFYDDDSLHAKAVGSRSNDGGSETRPPIAEEVHFLDLVAGGRE